MENKRPSFQFYPSDWLADRNTQIMTAEEEGAYIRLICFMWETEDCVLPLNIEYLSRLARVGSTVVQNIIHCFVIDGENITHKRLQKERKKQDEWVEKSRLAGIKSGQVRAKNRRLVKNGSNQTRTKSNSPTPSSSPSPTPILKSSKEDSGEASFGDSRINEILEFLKKTFGLSDFKESRKEQRIWGKHLVGLVEKLGRENFRGGLTGLAKDSFRRKNCNSLRFIYSELKSMPTDEGLLPKTPIVAFINPKL